MKPETLRLLKDWNQPELAEHLAALDVKTSACVEEELYRIDFPLLKDLFLKYQSGQKNRAAQEETFQSIVPPDSAFCTLDTTQIFNRSERSAQYIAAGKCAMVILAGGMGSRLGHSAPKGTFPITPVTGKSLFQVHFEKIALLRRHYDTPIRTYVMTNSATHAPTCEFLCKNHYFGVPESDVCIFPQNEIPAMNPQNRSLYFSPDGHIYFGPDGHGGLISALKASDVYSDLHRHGIETVNTFHVDNPLVPILNEQFLDEHLRRESDMSSIAVEKIDGMELVGNIVERETSGKKELCVIEYMDFPGEYAMKTRPEGSLRFWAGSVGIHLIQVQFLEEMESRIASDPDFMPYHLPLKKILTNEGEVWAIKPERFIFDVLPCARNPVVGRAADRDEIFTTLKKNPETVRNHLSDLYAAWLRRAGAVFPDDARVEIAPDFALDFATLRTRIAPGTTFEKDEIYLKNL